MKTININKINKESLSIKAYKAVKNIILAKEISGKINQEYVAKRLGISRTPLVYALNRLEAEGFLEVKPYKGFFIKKYDKKEFLEIIEVRLLFESFGVEKLINDLSDKDIKVLKNFVKKFKNYYKNNDIGKYRNLDIIFHNYIISKTKNRYIIKEYKDYIQVPVISSGFIPIDISVKNHEDLVEAIILKDLKKAKDLIEKHLRSLTLNN